MNSENDFLEQAKQQQKQQLTVELGGLSHSTMIKLPSTEVESWVIQKYEAAAIAEAGKKATIDMAPFLTAICFYQYGESDAESTLAQVLDKAESVNAKASAFSELAAFVAGTRARGEAEIDAAENIGEVLSLMNDLRADIQEFRQKAGI